MERMSEKKQVSQLFSAGVDGTRERCRRRSRWLDDVKMVQGRRLLSFSRLGDACKIEKWKSAREMSVPPFDEQIRGSTLAKGPLSVFTNIWGGSSAEMRRNVSENAYSEHGVGIIAGDACSTCRLFSYSWVLCTVSVFESILHSPAFRGKCFLIKKGK